MKSSRKVLIATALFLCVTNLSCQQKSQTPPSSNSNQPAPSKLQSTLSIEAGLVYKSGDAKPVPRTEFYLLDDDAEKILNDAKIERKGRLKNLKDFSLLHSYATAKLCVNRLTRCPMLKESWDFVQAATEALKPHIVKSVTTGFDGKASFESVVAGTYYVMGIYLQDEAFVSWNVKVELNSESQQMILDQNNSSFIYQH
ncbi:MAG: hypothetical protein H0T60_04465 [Acidobacteria bacterium]|nr:hypothetical protein [Acidobacteriota bacterium]